MDFKKICTTVALVLCSCTPPTFKNEAMEPPARSVDFSLKITEDFESQRFELVLSATGERAICLHRHEWPNSQGHLHFAGKDVYVLVSGRRFPIATHNFGYCIGPDCVIQIESGNSLKATIPFTEFDEEMYSAPEADRKLFFRVTPTICK